METKNQKTLILTGSLGGLFSVISYFVIAFFDLPVQLAFLGVMLFTILGIIGQYSLKEYISNHKDSHANNLSFIFGSLAFTICALFLSAQLAVEAGINMNTNTDFKAIKYGVRQIDMGMDVAWDTFIGTYMLLFFIATRKVAALKWWGVVSGGLGFLLVLLNIYTFPQPPVDMDLFDVGPFIALFWIALYVRLLITAIGVKRPLGV